MKRQGYDNETIKQLKQAYALFIRFQELQEA